MGAADGRGAEAAAAAARVRAAGVAPGALGLVLGSGLGTLADRLAERVAVPMAASAWLPPVSALGHAGRIVSGRVRGCAAVALCGRVHAYEGCDDATLGRGVALLAALGARAVLLTNAAGGLRPDMVEGEILVIEDHLDLVRRPGAAASCGPADAPRQAGVPVPAGVPGPAGAARGDACLVQRAVDASRRAGVAARAGVYARVLGPSYETRAEYRFLRRAGADAVGMSTVPEILAARRLGMEVVALSVITNVARPDAARATLAEDVCRVAAGAEAGVWGVIEALADRLGAGAAATAGEAR